MATHEVLTIINSFNGGYNGDVPGKEIGIELLSDTEAIFTLTHYYNQVPGTWDVVYLDPPVVERHRIVVELLPNAPEPEEAPILEPEEGVA